jgi:hypothetical protein
VIAVLAILVISGDLSAAYERLRGGQENLNVLVPRYGMWSIIRLDWPELTWGELLSFLFLTAAALAAIYWVRVKTSWAPAIELGLAAMVILVCAICFLYPSALDGLGERPQRTGLIIAAVPIAVLLAAVARRFFQGAPLGTDNTGVIARSVLLAVAPFIVAAGTGNNVAQQMTFFSFFWVLSAFNLARGALGEHVGQPAARITLASALVITTAMITAGAEIPYRQSTALRLQQTPVSIGPDRNQRVLVDDETARYLNELFAALDARGFRKGDGIIDMTGESPGVIYAVGGKALGEPWLLGRYVGSAEFATQALKRVPCGALASAWILSAPEGRRAIPTSVLTENRITPSPEIANLRVRSSKKMHTLAPPAGRSEAQSCPQN